jgi:type II secretory pathway component GspD/PulD (secretin)
VGEIMTRAIMVSVTDEYLNRINEVANSLTREGMQIEQTLSTVGIISGNIDENKLVDIGHIPGVGSIEQERTYQLAPPNSPQ